MKHIPHVLLFGAFALLHGATVQSTSTITDASTTTVAISYGATVQSTSTTTASAATHTVTLGYQGGYRFIPNVTTADPGDTIVFRFVTTGHAVAEASYGDPCIPFDTINPGEPSFDSGFKNFTGTPAVFPTWNLTVNDTSPVYYYCYAINACLVDHMIGVINPNSTFTLQSQESYITSDTIMLQPGQALPAEGASPSSSSSSASTSASTSTSTSTAAPSATSSAASNSHKGVSLSTGAIVGIVIAGVAILGLACALFWFIGRHRTMKRENSAVDRWVKSQGGPPSSFGPASTQGDQSTAEMAKTWEGQPLYGYPSPCVSPPLPIQELGVVEMSELGDDGQERGRPRMIQHRFSAPAKTQTTAETHIYEKE